MSDKEAARTDRPNTSTTAPSRSRPYGLRTVRSPSTGTVEDRSSALFPAGCPGSPPESALPVGGLRMAQRFAHDPVMVDEVVALLGPVPPGVVVDATVGGGGHAAALLAAHPHLALLGLDRDPDALAAAAERLQPFAGRVALRHARFGDLAAEVAAARAAGGDAWPSAGAAAAEDGPASDLPVLSGVLFDLGVSSPQLDRADRGFSYRNQGPLDMRMDQTTGRSALELVNEADAGELAALFAANGEGRLARRIARAVVAARPITTTGQLAEVVASAVPAALRRRGHPARRVFQALRIAVNEEMDELAAVLPAALDLLAWGGGWWSSPITPVRTVWSSRGWPTPSPVVAPALPACPACVGPGPNTGWCSGARVVRRPPRSRPTTGPRAPGSGPSSGSR